MSESESTRRDSQPTIVRVTAAVLLTSLVGYLLYLGQSLLIPIVIAMIFVYIIGAFDDKLAELPVTRYLPRWLRTLTLYIVFIALLAGFAALVTSTIQQLVYQAPQYQSNIQSLLGGLLDILPIEKLPDWPTLRDMMMSRFNLQGWLGSAATQLSSAGGALFMIIIYIAFLAGERNQLSDKLAAAFPDPENAARTHSFISQINVAVGSYLGAKTLINVIVGVVSWAVMWGFGLHYAVFWAFLIAILNYIPYIGSIIAVLLPTLWSLAQFGSWTQTLILFVLLQIIQLITGNVLEPQMLGRKVNLSPFVVLVALAFWSAIWGIAGAILAVPLTSILTIIFKEIPSTRPLAILMSDETEPVLRSLNRAKLLRRMRRAQADSMKRPSDK